MMYLKYLKSLFLHKWYVFVAGLKLGVPLWRLVIHDWSKFTPAEFPHYARNFFGERTDDVRAAFARAWLHHENHNPHHWGYWTQARRDENRVLPMPETYVREMIADWMGANMTYQGTWDMSKWLARNGPGLLLHDDTTTMIHDILIREQRYFLTDNCPWLFTWGGNAQ